MATTLCLLLLLVVPAAAIQSNSFLTSSSANSLSVTQRLMAEKRLRNSISHLSTVLRSHVPKADSLDLQALAVDARGVLRREAEKLPYKDLANVMASYAKWAPDSVLVAPLIDDDEAQHESPIGHTSLFRQNSSHLLLQADSLDLHALAGDARDQLLQEAEEMPYDQVADFMANYATQATDSELVAPFKNDDEVQRRTATGHTSAMTMTGTSANSKDYVASNRSLLTRRSATPNFESSQSGPFWNRGCGECIPHCSCATPFCIPIPSGSKCIPGCMMFCTKWATRNGGSDGDDGTPMLESRPVTEARSETASDYGKSEPDPYGGPWLAEKSPLHQAMEHVSHELNGLGKIVGRSRADDILRSIFNKALLQAHVSDQRQAQSG